MLHLLLPPTSTLFPYTTLFRSEGTYARIKVVVAVAGPVPDAKYYATSLPGPQSPPLYRCTGAATGTDAPATADRKSTRLNSSHMSISYAVFCLKKKKNTQLYK